MILDTDTLLAFFDRGHERHWAVAGQVEFLGSFDQLVVSPFVIAELERVVRERYGDAGWLAMLDELAGGAWTIAVVDAAHLTGVGELVRGGVTMAGASVAVLVEGDS